MAIENMKDLCYYFGAEEPSGLNRRIYKDTDCGASISVCVRNPRNTRPDRVEMVVRNATYTSQKYRWASATVECWVDDDQDPSEGRILKVERQKAAVDDPGELDAYAKALSLDEVKLFWDNVSMHRHSKAPAPYGGYLVTVYLSHDPITVSLPCLEIEELWVGDRLIPTYRGDNLRDAYRDCRWFEQWSEQVWTGVHFHCGTGGGEFWPQDPKEARGKVQTLDNLKQLATRFIEYDGRTKLVWELKHPQHVADVVTVTAIIRRNGNGCELTQIGHQLDDSPAVVPHMADPLEWAPQVCDEPWYRGVEDFFALKEGLSSVTLEDLRRQDWEERDEVQLDSDPEDQDGIRLTKVFRSKDRAYGWKLGSAGDFVWVHNGSGLWPLLTHDTELRSFTIQSIVEGSDATVDSDEFTLPVDEQQIKKFLAYMEDETSALWKQANTDLYAVSGCGIDAVVRNNWGDLEVEAGELSDEQAELIERLLEQADYPRSDFEQDGVQFTLIEEELW